jgi:hypothetical protein
MVGRVCARTTFGVRTVSPPGGAEYFGGDRQQRHEFPIRRNRLPSAVTTFAALFGNGPSPT